MGTEACPGLGTFFFLPPGSGVSIVCRPEFSSLDRFVKLIYIDRWDVLSGADGTCAWSTGRKTGGDCEVCLSYYRVYLLHSSRRSLCKVYKGLISCSTLACVLFSLLKDINRQMKDYLFPSTVATYLSDLEFFDRPGKASTTILPSTQHYFRTFRAFR